MCGIVGFTGRRRAAPILLDGLAKLEYRGYDSAGLAVRDGDEPAQVVKAVGKLRNLAEKTDGGAALAGCCGIGHTRWATHGAPSLINAHPHVSGSCVSSGSDAVESQVVGVHNGIIENCSELKAKLERHGYTFYSDTDTETAVKLVDYYYKKYKLGPVDALTRAMVRIQGSYALALMFQDYPGEIFAARKDSPMILGVAEGETYLASDVPAILNDTRNVYYIGNQQAARLSPGEVHFYDLNGDEVELPLTEITWDAQAAEKGGYQHFMLKEIHEQPAAVRDTLNSLLKDGRLDLSGAGLTEEVLQSVSSIHIAACGSAWHVGVAAQYVLEELAEVPVRVELASEFRYRRLLLDENALVIVISQSGETADTLAALREAKRRGVRTLAVVNVVGSTIAREADNVLYTLAGPEIAVATTKAYSTQLAVLDLLGLYIARRRGSSDAGTCREVLEEMARLPEKLEQVLSRRDDIQYLASQHFSHSSVFYMGRNVDYALGLEGSLKLKEISYIHSEAYAAGELKHGTISLIEPGTLVVALGTYPPLTGKTVSNIQEVRSRGGQVLAVTTESHREDFSHAAGAVITVPDTHPMLLPSLTVAPLQLFAYYVALMRGCDVDKPRNLAKSVTVE